MSPEDARNWFNRVRRIRGWFWPAAAYLFAWLDDIQKSWQIRGDIAEIGCFHGRSAAFLAALLDRSEPPAPGPPSGAPVPEPERLRVCDPFALHDPGFPSYLSRFRANLAALHGPCPWLEVHAMTSDRLTTAETGVNVRLFHIDGGHEAATVEHDLATAAASLRRDGLAILDDACNFAWPGVIEGTFRYLEREPGQFAPLLIAFNKLVLCRPDWHGRYQAALRDAARCWSYIPRGPLARKSLDFCGTIVDILHAPARRSPDPLRTLLSTVHQLRPELAETLAQWTGYQPAESQS